VHISVAFLFIYCRNCWFKQHKSKWLLQRYLAG